MAIERVVLAAGHAVESFEAATPLLEADAECCREFRPDDVSQSRPPSNGSGSTTRGCALAGAESVETGLPHRSFASFHAIGLYLDCSSPLTRWIVILLFESKQSCTATSTSSSMPAVKPLKTRLRDATQTRSFASAYPLQIGAPTNAATDESRRLTIFFGTTATIISMAMLILALYSLWRTIFHPAPGPVASAVAGERPWPFDRLISDVSCAADGLSADDSVELRTAGPSEEHVDMA